MRAPRLVALIALAIVVVGCSSSVAPGWTYTPTKAPPPGSSPSSAVAGATGGPGAAGASTPAAGASGAASAGSAGSASGAGTLTVSLTAQNVAFTQTKLTAPSGKAFTLRFTNADTGVPHNVVITSSSGQQVFSGSLLTGPASTSYAVPALPAGTYGFHCAVHPQMVGTLTAR